MQSGRTTLCPSFRDVEDLLAERGIIVSYKTIRHWCLKFGPDYAWKLKRREGRPGDHWHLDEVFIRINGQQQYLWRAVDQDCDVIDILVQPHRDQRAAERFFRRLLRGQGVEPLRITTDQLRSYSAAMRTIFGNVTHSDCGLSHFPNPAFQVTMSQAAQVDNPPPTGAIFPEWPITVAHWKANDSAPNRMILAP
jgi:putative transposase